MTSTYTLVNNLDPTDIKTFKIKHDAVPKVRDYIKGIFADKYLNANPIKLWTKTGEVSYELWRNDSPFEDGMTIYYTPPKIYNIRINIVDYNNKTDISTMDLNSDELEQHSQALRNHNPGVLWWVRSKNVFVDSYIPWDGIFKQHMTIYHSQYKAIGGKRKNKSRKRRATRLKKRKTNKHHHK